MVFSSKLNLRLGTMMTWGNYDLKRKKFCEEWSVHVETISHFHCATTT
jgi:hypothetical protein